jgi:hypothetical protein
MSIHGKLLGVGSIAALIFTLGCHPDFLWFHDCTENLGYSPGWGDYGLEFDHFEPRICPVDMGNPGDYLLTAAVIVDDLPRDFWSSEFWIKNSNSPPTVINGPQYDYFHEHDLGGGATEWAVEINAQYPVGTGYNVCYDNFVFKMALRYPGSPGGLPDAQGKMTYIYPDGPCSGNSYGR